jgi:hypothetical protein
MIGLGFDGVSRAVRRLRQRFSPAAVILLYHWVCEVETDPWDLSVSLEHLTQQFEVLRYEGLCLTLADLMARWEEGKRLPPRCFVVNFADGYGDNLHNARPLLDRFDVPATVFLVSSMLGAGEEFWWDVPYRVFLQQATLPRHLSLTVDAVTHRWRLTGDAHYMESMHCQHRGWQAEDGLDPAGRSDYASLTATEAQQLQSDDLIESGLTPGPTPLYRTSCPRPGPQRLGAARLSWKPSSAEILGVSHIPTAASPGHDVLRQPARFRRRLHEPRGRCSKAATGFAYRDSTRRTGMATLSRRHCASIYQNEQGTTWVRQCQ